MRSLAGQRSVSQCSGRQAKASAPVVLSRRHVACFAVAVAPPPQPVANSQPAVAVSSQSARHGYSDAVLLQGFGWDSCQQHRWYEQVTQKVPEIKGAGFTHVWLPPPSQSVSAQGYMPGQLYNLKSAYGDKEDLKRLVQALKYHGVKAVADIVINHRCADEQGPEGVWNRYRDDVDHTGKRIDWEQWAITSNDPNFKGTGNPDTGDDYGPAPDLDHANPALREALKTWLSWLKEDIGFEGWRLDFARGYGAQFVKEYVEATTSNDEFNVGEFWTDLRWNGPDLDYNQDAARQRLCDWINANGKTCAAFDFPTKGTLNEAFKNTQFDRLRDHDGKAPGLMGWWPGMAVTFIANHDTDSTANHWPFPGQHVEGGYAYLLTHPGIPCVFWDHMFKWGPDVRKAIVSLLKLRKGAGIHADSRLDILAAERDMYVARIGGRLTIKLGPRFDMGSLVPKADDGWQLAASGKDWAAWELHV